MAFNWPCLPAQKRVCLQRSGCCISKQIKKEKSAKCSFFLSQTKQAELCVIHIKSWVAMSARDLHLDPEVLGSKLGPFCTFSFYFYIFSLYASTLHLAQLHKFMCVCATVNHNVHFIRKLNHVESQWITCIQVYKQKFNFFVRTLNFALPNSAKCRVCPYSYTMATLHFAKRILVG
jgi:hypothetical protein